MKLIRKGNKQEAIVSEVVLKRIQPYDRDLYKSYMTGEKEEENMPCDFFYSDKGSKNILPWFGITISYFASLKAVYFCRHLRDHRTDYRWLAVTFFLKKYLMYRNND